MRSVLLGCVCGVVWLAVPGMADADGSYLAVSYPASTEPGELQLGVTYIRATRKLDNTIELTWEVEADFESGLQAFIVQRDGKDLAQIPEKPVGRFGRPLFQTMSYHDTPERPRPEMRLVDRSPTAGVEHEYRVMVVNGVGLRSQPSSPVSVP
jgi:hypothetical protein